MKPKLRDANQTMLFRSAKIDQLSDQELVTRYKKTGKNEFLGELFQRYQHLVYGVCLKYLKNEDEGQDAVISIFEKLMTDLHKHEVSNFRSWLHSVARNHCLMALRSKAAQEKRLTAYQYSENGQPDDEEERQEKELKEAQLSELEEAIQELKPEQRTCIELFFLEQKCYKEIVAISGFDLKQVKSYIQNGKRNLKIILQRRNEQIFTS